MYLVFKVFIILAFEKAYLSCEVAVKEMSSNAEKNTITEQNDLVKGFRVICT